MTRTAAAKRHYDHTKALRKYRIYKVVYPNNKDWADYLLEHKGLNSFSKNKIHCSCPLCSEKSTILGSPISDKRRIAAMENNLEESGFSKTAIRDRHKRGW